jgi:hypothetical protein
MKGVKRHQHISSCSLVSSFFRLSLVAETGELSFPTYSKIQSTNLSYVSLPLSVSKNELFISGKLDQSSIVHPTKIFDEPVMRNPALGGQRSSVYSSILL